MTERKIPARNEWICDGCGKCADATSLPLRWARVLKDREWDVASDAARWDYCPTCADKFEKAMTVLQASLRREP